MPPPNYLKDPTPTIFIDVVQLEPDQLLHLPHLTCTSLRGIPSVIARAWLTWLAPPPDQTRPTLALRADKVSGFRRRFRRAAIGAGAFTGETTIHLAATQWRCAAACGARVGFRPWKDEPSTYSSSSPRIAFGSVARRRGHLQTCNHLTQTHIPHHTHISSPYPYFLTHSISKPIFHIHIPILPSKGYVLTVITHSVPVDP